MDKAFFFRLAGSAFSILPKKFYNEKWHKAIIKRLSPNIISEELWRKCSAYMYLEEKGANSSCHPGQDGQTDTRHNWSCLNKYSNNIFLDAK